MAGDLFITKPLVPTKLYHIFGKDHRSLCGKFLVLNPSPKCCEPFTGEEEPPLKGRKGEDCVVCFKKAGIPIS
jgi:hypothetical protein